MTEELIKKMLNGIINNGEKWEGRPKGYYCSEEQKYVDEQCDYDACAHTCRDDCYGDWRPYKLGDEIHADWEYRKVEKRCVTTQKEIIELNLLKSYETPIFIGSKEECEKWIEEHTKKTWLEENYPDFQDEEGLNSSARNGITFVCKKILEEVDKGNNLCSASYYLKQIIKDLGIELEEQNK